MEFLYHVQNQALDFAKKIIPVPDSFPLADGVWDGFPQAFSKLCDIAKNIFFGMAERPDDYGLTLVPISETDGNLIRDGYRTIHRFPETLSALCSSGSFSDGVLTVNRADFVKNAKKINKSGVILDRLSDFGFIFTGRDCKSAEFTAEFPDDPDVLRAAYEYSRCWNRVCGDKSKIKIRPKEFHHHFFAFDYKVASDMDAIPAEQWIDDEARYFGLDEGKTRIWRELHERISGLKGVKFDGEYYFKGKRIIRPFTENHTHDSLTIKLGKMDSYPQIIEKLPDSIKNVFTRDYCTVCGFQGATQEKCKFRLRWTLDGQPHKGCAFWCFQFKNPDPEHLDAYVDMIKAEYNL